MFLFSPKNIPQNNNTDASIVQSIKTMKESPSEAILEEKKKKYCQSQQKTAPIIV